jgi:hypothetical protein
MVRVRLTVLALVCVAVACSDAATSDTLVPPPSSTAVSTTFSYNTVEWTTTTEWTIPAPPTTYVEVDQPALREELLLMFREDQAERTGEGLPPGTPLPPMQDYVRAERLKAIIAEFGWPTVDLVGTDGAQAAWVIAQHADHDVDFQREAVELMRVAAEAGQADMSEYAYLVDRVAVNSGEPQTYGSQIRCRNGVPDPATPLAEPSRIDEIRASVGLGPLADYYLEFEMGCRSEQAAGESTTT